MVVCESPKPVAIVALSRMCSELGKYVKRAVAIRRDSVAIPDSPAKPGELRQPFPQLSPSPAPLGLCPHTLRRAIAAGELEAPPGHPPLPQLI